METADLDKGGQEITRSTFDRDIARVVAARADVGVGPYEHARIPRS
jgi:hypothetical protein